MQIDHRLPFSDTTSPAIASLSCSIERNCDLAIIEESSSPLSDGKLCGASIHYIQCTSTPILYASMPPLCAQAHVHTQGLAGSHTNLIRIANDRMRDSHPVCALAMIPRIGFDHGQKLGYRPGNSEMPEQRALRSTFWLERLRPGNHSGCGITWLRRTLNISSFSPTLPQLGRLSS